MSLRDEIADAIASQVRPGRYCGVEGIGEATDEVLALLRGGPWFDEAVGRMVTRWRQAGPRESDEIMRLDHDAMSILLGAALGEDT